MDERKEHWVLSEIDVSVFPSCFQIVNLLHILYINVNLCKQIFFFFKFWQTLFFSFSLFFSKAEKNGKKKKKKNTIQTSGSLNHRPRVHYSSTYACIQVSHKDHYGRRVLLFLDSRFILSLYQQSLLLFYT